MKTRKTILSDTIAIEEKKIKVNKGRVAKSIQTKAILAATVSILLGFGSTAHCALTVHNANTSDQFFTDDVAGINWYSDIHRFLGMTYAQQLSAVEALNVGGLDWTIATRAQIFELNYYNVGRDIIGAGLFTTITDSVMGRTSTTYTTGQHWVASGSTVGTNLNVAYGYSDSIYGNERMGAFAVSTGTYVVPLPASLLLFGSGLGVLGGLGGLKRGRGKTIKA